MTTKTAILTFVLLLLLAGGVVLGVYLVRQNQDARSRADVVATPIPTQTQSLDQLTQQQQQNLNPAQAQGQSCTPPAEVSNVSVNYPDCQ